MSTARKRSPEDVKDYGWDSGGLPLTSIRGTRMEYGGLVDPPKVYLAQPPWNTMSLPEKAQAKLQEMVPDINDQELFLFQNTWQRYFMDQDKEASARSARTRGREIAAVHDAASALLEAIDLAQNDTISLLADRYHRLAGHSQAPYMPAHITYELCRLVTAICEDHFMFEFAKAARDKKRGPTPMTRSGADINFVGSIHFWLEGLSRRQPTYSELQQLVDAFCEEKDALKGHVQSRTNKKK